MRPPVTDSREGDTLFFLSLRPDGLWVSPGHLLKRNIELSSPGIGWLVFESDRAFLSSTKKYGICSFTSTHTHLQGLELNFTYLM
jgi:hypothetical protein